MSGFSMKIIGIQEVVSALDKGVRNLPNEIKTLTQRIDRRVIQATPRHFGVLASNIRFETGRDWGRVYVVAPAFDYAPFVELGTYKMEARHVEPNTNIRILGQGMFGYALETMQDELKDFEVRVVKETEGEFK